MSPSLDKKIIMISFKYIFGWCFFFLVSTILWSQDEGFSAYRFTALAQNPAESGRIETQSQLSILYRTQWNTVIDKAYQSAFVGFESQLFCPNESFVALGISVAGERSGASKFTRANGNISLAYHQRLNNDFFLSGGGEIGMLSYRINAENLRFDAQFDGIGYNPSLPNFEAFAEASNIKIDAAVGALLYRQNGRFSFGVSINHLNAPVISLLEGSEYIVGLSGTIHGNFGIATNNKIKYSKVVNFHFLYKNYGFVNNKQWYTIVGADFLIPFSGQKKQGPLSYFDFDLAIRLAGRATGALVSDAIIATGNVSIDGWEMGMSYDFNLSPLSTATNTFGALEFFLNFPLSRQVKCVECPRVGNPTN